MFKHMLYGVVVMTASYVHSMEKASPQKPKVTDMFLLMHCANPYCQGDLPGWSCQRAAINRNRWIPFNPQDQDVTAQRSWKSLSKSSHYE